MPDPLSTYPKLKRFWGLLEYKSQWTLTLQGWALLLLALGAIALIFLTQIQPFLAVSQPIKAEVLVVEGWMGDEALQGAIAEFKNGNYQLIVTTGMPLSRGSYFVAYKNYAELAAATLTTLGIRADQIVIVPTPKVNINRTLASALVLKAWLSRSHPSIQSLNLFSFDVHTRRSWLLFKKVLEPETKVGCIAYPSEDYDLRRWWTSSEGVKAILSETIAYLYTLGTWL
jgi:hypothetical protein